MHQQLTVNTALIKRNRRMNQNRVIKTLVLLLVVVILLGVSANAAQTPLPLKVDDTTLVSVLPANVDWAKTYGGASDDRAFYALPVDDGFLVVGSSNSAIANTTVGWAIKLDGDGNAVLNKTYLEGFGTELRYAVNLTGGFLLVGNEFYSTGEVHGYVAKIDTQGNLLWKTILSEGTTDKLFSGIAAPDGFAVFGLTSSNSNGASSAWIVKLNLNGKEVWNKTYGEQADSTLRAGVLSDDGAYVAAGYIDSKGDGNYDFYLLKVDSDGSMVWNRTYGGLESEKAYAMTKAPDGYVLTGEVESTTSSTDAWVLKVDASGNPMWNKTVGGKEADSPSYITPAKEGGYLVAGFTFSFGAGQRDFWLFKISDQGEVQFSCTQGDKAFQEAYSVIEKGNNKYVMVGWTDPIGQPDLIGKKMYDFYVVQLSVAQGSFLQSSYQVVTYAATVTAILLAALLLIYKIRSKGKKIVKT